MNHKKLYSLFIGAFVYISCLAQNKSDTTFNVYFQTNSFELDLDQYERIKQIIASYSTITQIKGYADTSGAMAYNLVLSKKRALTIYMLIKNYVDSLNPEGVAYDGESAEMPAAWMNRRVQIRARKALIYSLERSDALYKPDTIRAFDLENLYFVPDKPILSQESIPYIHELANALKTYQNNHFEIIGHVNYQSRLDSSQLRDFYQLSELRAKAVYDYLLEFGIPATRMTYKGVGNSRPLIASPVNDEEKRKNMRVQVVILK